MKQKSQRPAEGRGFPPGTPVSPKEKVGRIVGHGPRICTHTVVENLHALVEKLTKQNFVRVVRKPLSNSIYLEFW